MGGMSTGNTLVWAGLILLGAAMLAPDLPGGAPAPDEPPKRADKPGARTPDQPVTAGNGLAGQTLIRAPDGHFYADAQVNGARIRFMVDTGASMVALTHDDAQRAGIALGDERGFAQGAGGEIAFTPVTIDRLAVGPLEARAVRGAVADELPVSLLGQSFLERVGSVEIRGDSMVLR